MRKTHFPYCNVCKSQCLDDLVDMPNECHTKCFMKKWMVYGKYGQSVEKDLRKMKILRWWDKLNDRKEQRHTVWEAKANLGLWALADDYD